MEAITIEKMVERWDGAERPLFKGSLIDEDGCYCAQGDVLHCAGFTDTQLRNMKQSKADVETAKLLGISRSHAVLLRLVNDQADGAPSVVLTAPEKILGSQAPLVLAFWKRLDEMTDEQWDAAWAAAWDAARDAAGDAAWDAAWAAAWDAAWDAAGDAAMDAAWDAARDAAWDAAWAAARDAARAAGDAARASNEIQGAELLERDGREPYFLKFFGIDTWEMLRGIL